MCKGNRQTNTVSTADGYGIFLFAIPNLGASADQDANLIQHAHGNAKCNLRHNIRRRQDRRKDEDAKNHVLPLIGEHLRRGQADPRGQIQRHRQLERNSKRHQEAEKDRYDNQENFIAPCAHFLLCLRHGARCGIIFFHEGGADMRSMTGCGRSQQSDGQVEMTLELKCVNHRFLDVSCRLPRSLSFLEETLRKGISASLKRGHVDVFLAVKTVGEGNKRVTINEDLARAYFEAGQSISALTGCGNDLSLSHLMQMEGVLEVAEDVMDEDAMTALCERVTAEAVRQVVTMREREGNALKSDLTAHLDAACQLREKILRRAPQVPEEYRQRLQERLSKLPIEPVDPARLAQEVALMADHCAIDEELSRLESHIAQLRSYLEKHGEIGKKMDFLIQEMNREANTIGSKANDAVIAQLVVDLKSEIEKLREQIQNVE